MDRGLGTEEDEDAERQRVDAAWRRYGAAALRLATVLVGPDDAHDIACTAFLRVTGTTKWLGLDRPQSYLFRAVSNEASNYHRQRHRRWQRDLAAVADDHTLDDHADIDVIRALSVLSLRQRSVVFMVYWEDMTEAAVAEALGISAGTVHRTLARARSRLRRALR